MADIRTREVNKGSVKTIDRAANLSHRMKNATVKAKNHAGNAVRDDGRSETAYAEDNTYELARSAAYDTGRAFRAGGLKNRRSISERVNMWQGRVQNVQSKKQREPLPPY